jgi:hypothetical protein
MITKCVQIQFAVGNRRIEADNFDNEDKSLMGRNYLDPRHLNE